MDFEELDMLHPNKTQSLKEFQRKWTMPRDREKQIADAFIFISMVNHYMVGFNHSATLEELEKAKQILIVWSNDADNKSEIVERALDLIEVEIKGVKI